MKFEQSDLLGLHEKRVIFKLNDINGKINSENLECIRDQQGDSFILGKFYDMYGDKANGEVELEYEQYIKIVMDSDNIDGIAIDLKDAHVYINRKEIRWLLLKKEEEKYFNSMKIEDMEYDKAKVYAKHMENIRFLWLSHKYRDIEDYLSLIEEQYGEYECEFNYYYGRLCEARGYTVKAEKFYRNAVKLEPDNFWLFHQLALYYNRTKEINKEWITCKTAYVNFVDACGRDIIYSESIEGIINLMIVHKKCSKIRKKIYKRYIDKMHHADKQLNEKKYLVLD